MHVLVSTIPMADQVDATSANVDRPQILKLDNDDVLNTTDVCEVRLSAKNQLFSADQSTQDEHEEAQLNDSETALDDLSYSLPLCDRPQQESAPVSPGELCATPPSVSVRTWQGLRLGSENAHSRPLSRPPSLKRGLRRIKGIKAQV